MSSLIDTSEIPLQKPPMLSSFIPQNIDEIEKSRDPYASELDATLWTGRTLSEQSLQIDETLTKLENFVPFSGPWLPQQVLKLRDKLAKRKLTELECIKLLDLLAKRAVKHYQLNIGKFVAITLSGKIAEVADTKLGLLKRVQGRRYSEQIFVWKVGSDSFSGRK